MNFLAKTYQLLALTVNFIAGGLLLISAYSYLIPPDRFSLPYFFTLAFPVFFQTDGQRKKQYGTQPVT